MEKSCFINPALKLKGMSLSYSSLNKEIAPGIFLPNIVSIVNGEAKELIEGISEKQTEYNGELTEEIIKDEKEIFDNFFSKYK